MLRIAICDDMLSFLHQIQDYLTHWDNQPDELCVDTFREADSLLVAHQHTPYDIILLDVVMPLLNGIDAAREIRQADSRVRIVFPSPRSSPSKPS